MFCVSISYKQTPLEIRQRFAFEEQEQRQFLRQLMENGIITGGIIVSTCNRSELYFTGEKEKISALEKEISIFKQIEKEVLKKNCLYYSGEKAVKHLFKVTSGLDSMVLGEDEILHQVKAAYLFANQEGFCNSELNIIFQGAFHYAKFSKTSTKLSNTPVSIGTLTANMVEDDLKNLENKKVLLIGATGKIGSIVLKDLLAKGITVVATKGRHHKSEDTLLIQNDKLEWIEFSKRYAYVNQVSAIVSCTGSPHYILIKEEFQKWRRQEETLLIIDLAVPYDIDQEIGELPYISLLDIDYFTGKAKENHTIRYEEKEKVELILTEGVEETMKKLYLRDFKMTMGKQCEDGLFSKTIYSLKETLNSQQFFEVLQRIKEKGEI